MYSQGGNINSNPKCSPEDGKNTEERKSQTCGSSRFGSSYSGTKSTSAYNKRVASRRMRTLQPDGERTEQELMPAMTGSKRCRILEATSHSAGRLSRPMQDCPAAEQTIEEVEGPIGAAEAESESSSDAGEAAIHTGSKSSLRLRRPGSRAKQWMAAILMGVLGPMSFP